MAVKAFRLDLPPEQVHRLVAEFERLIAAGLTHPAVVAPVATGIEGVTAYLAQDYVSAESLDITLRHERPSVVDSLRVATQLAGALDAAARVHMEHGVLHPRDVLLSAADEVKLTGIGIARAVERIGLPAQVRRPYTAPERTIGSAWDRRGDVFGLAAMIHEMLWGRRVAGAGDDAAGSLTEIAGGDLARLRAVFGRALAEDPASRFDTALEFAAALKEALPGSDLQRDLVRTVGLQPDNAQPVRIKADTTNETTPAQSEPRLPLEPEDDVKKESEPVVTRGDFDLRPPVVPPELIDSYRPEPVPAEQSRSAISPLAFALVIGAALGFAAGFGVGTWGRSTDEADLASPDSAVASNATSMRSNPLNREAAATTGPAREFTEGTVADARPPVQAAPKPATPSPAVGSLLVRSTPLGARVLVDGREYGRTPVTVGNLSRGSHNVRVIRDGYEPDERQVTVTSAQRAHSMTVRLSPERAAPAASAVSRPAAPSAAPLTVESRPAGASVFLDGRVIGTTPLVVPNVAVGDHALHLELDGYQRWSSAIRIVTTERNRVTASLDR